MMPAMNGFEVCRRLRANSTLDKTSIVMVTAWDDPTAQARCLELGANAVICKPIRKAHLLQQFEELQ